MEFSRWHELFFSSLIFFCSPFTTPRLHFKLSRDSLGLGRVSGGPYAVWCSCGLSKQVHHWVFWWTKILEAPSIFRGTLVDFWNLVLITSIVDPISPNTLSNWAGDNSLKLGRDTRGKGIVVYHEVVYQWQNGRWVVSSVVYVWWLARHSPMIYKLPLMVYNSSSTPLTTPNHTTVHLPHIINHKITYLVFDRLPNHSLSPLWVMICWIWMPFTRMWMPFSTWNHTFDPNSNHTWIRDVPPQPQPHLPWLRRDLGHYWAYRIGGILMRKCHGHEGMNYVTRPWASDEDNIRTIKGQYRHSPRGECQQSEEPL